MIRITPPDAAGTASEHRTSEDSATGNGPYSLISGNIRLPSPFPRDPIAWMQTAGMSDPNCKWINDAGQLTGAKFIALQRGRDNGCSAPSDIPTTTVGSKTHVCYDLTGCKQGYPVKACTFDGAHIANVGDGGTGNVGKDSWIPVESWKFFRRF